MTNGPVAMMIATFDTLVSCSAGMKDTMPNVESDATSQPLVLHPEQIAQAGAALQQHHDDGDQTPAEQPAPEQDGPGIERKQPREERRRAARDGGGDDEGNPEAMLGLRPGHVRNPV